MEIEKIKRELQANQRSHLEEREEEEPELPGTISNGERKPKAAFTTEDETEIHQQRDRTYTLTFRHRASFI